MDFTYPENILFECNRCGLCCGDTKEKKRHILLLQTEADEISKKTSVSKQEFSSIVTDKTPYLYEMKKTEEGKCFFLKDNTCEIYSYRPLICRFYPFELKFSHDKDTHVFDFTLECPKINSGRSMHRKDFEEMFVLAKEKLG